LKYVKRKKNHSRLFAAIGVFALIILVAAYFFAPKIEESIEEIRHPLEYEEEIYLYSEEFGVDPFLIMGLIHTESAFDSQAESYAGAMGLMQIMPDTGEWLAEKMNIEDFSTDMLLTADFSIRMGSFYLSMLIDYYGTTDTALAAYNAGMGTVSAWLQDSSYSYNGETLYYIPYTETREYVVKVNTAAEKYRELYGQE